MAINTNIGNRPDTKERTLEKKGVKLKSNSERLVRFVGQDAKDQFLATAARAVIAIEGGNPDFAVLGQAYNSGVYQKTAGSKERTYENVYGDNDFTASASDPSVKKALDQAFGNVEGAAGTETGLTEKTLISVLGRSSALPNVPSLREQGNLSFRAQNDIADLPDESTSGIKGVGDRDESIEPIV